MNSAKAIIPIKEGKRINKVREQSSAERNFVVGVWVDAPTDAPQKLDENYEVLTRAAFDSAYLSLRINTTDVYEQVSLRHIEQCNAQGKPYYVQLPKRINLSDSKIEVMNSDATQANAAVGLRFDYLIPK